MKKQGISLIVLIVTIIVIIIIAATVILTVSKNNPIEMAKEAVFKEDVRTFQNELNMVIAEEYAENNGKRYDKITALEYTKGNEKNSVYTYLSSFKKKYENKIAIKEDEIVYIGLDEKEREWLLNSGIYMAKKITVHYKDGYGNNLKDREEYPMLDVQYKFEAPEIEGYMVLNEVEEGIASGDIEITFEYCEICNDLAFVGLDSSGNETDVEADIVAYTVAGMGECNNPYVAIPREYKGKSVTQIKSNAFQGNSVIKSIVISDTIEKINGNSFWRCSKLEYVKLDAKTVNDWFAFSCANLKKVEIGKNVEYIVSYAFDGCSKLTEVKLYSEKVKLNSQIFRGCTSLSEIKVNDENNSFKSVDGVIYSKDKTVIYMYPPAKQGVTYDMLSETKEIGIAAFFGNLHLIQINISDTVEEVKDSAFSGCTKLEYVKLNAKTVSGRFSFSCTNLRKLEIGENVEELGGVSFDGCSKLTDVKLYSEKVKLNNFIFRGCISLEEIKVNEENKAFKEVDGVVYSKNGTVIYMYPSGKTGETYVIPGEVKELGSHSFAENKYLAEIYIPSTVEKVNGYAFSSCTNLEYAKIDAKKLEGAYIFSNSNLNHVEIGGNVEYMWLYTFNGCSDLISINYLGTIDMWNNIPKSGWNHNSSITEVICTDGTVIL